MKFTKKPLNTFNKLSKKSTKFFKRNLRKIFKGGEDELTDITNWDKKWKDELTRNKDIHNTAEFYKEMRHELLEQGGLNKIKDWLVAKNLADKNTNKLYIDGLAGGHGFNIHITKPNGTYPLKQDANQEDINYYKKELEDNKKYITNEKFYLSFNLKNQDDNWDKEQAKTGNASMSEHHRFLTIKDPTIRRFNVLTFGMDYNSTIDNTNADLLKEDIELLKQMKDAALLYVDKARENKEWSEGTDKDVGLFFHCFPFNSIQSLHLHIVDLNNTGDSFDFQKHKNLPIDDVIQVLEKELPTHLQPTVNSKMNEEIARKQKRNNILNNYLKVKEKQWKRGGKKHTRKLHKIKRRKNNTRRRRRH